MSLVQNSIVVENNFSASLKFYSTKWEISCGRITRSHECDRGTQFQFRLNPLLTDTTYLRSSNLYQVAQTSEEDDNQKAYHCEMGMSTHVHAYTTK